MKTSPSDRRFIAELAADNLPAEDGRTTSERMRSGLQASVAQTPALLPLPISVAPRHRTGRSGSSWTFRMSSVIVGLAAGLALIAYAEGVFNTTAIAPSSTTSVPPAKIPGALVPAPAEVVRTAIPAKTVETPKTARTVKVRTATRPPSSRPVAAEKRRTAGSTRSMREDRASTARPLADVERPRRRNFLGLRTVAGWITGSKSDRSDRADRKSAAEKANASAR